MQHFSNRKSVLIMINLDGHGNAKVVCYNESACLLPLFRDKISDPKQTGFFIGAEMKEIQLTQGQVAIVDDADYEWLNQWKWYARRSGTTYYAQRTVAKFYIKQSIKMHREIMVPPSDMVVDHINGNGLDNRRENLRICTREENVSYSWNGGTGNKTGFKGVYCRAEIRVDGRIINLGTFATPEEAARAYDEAAKKYYGKSARLNFPNK